MAYKKSGGYSGGMSKNDYFSELLHNHLERISFSASNDISFGDNSLSSLSWAIKLDRQVLLFETFLQPFLDNEYHLKKNKIKIPIITCVSKPINLMLYTHCIFERLGLLIVFAYSNNLIKRDMVNKTELENISEEELM